MDQTGASPKVGRQGERSALRLTAPSDGFDDITVPLDTLALDRKASDYARQWRRDENTRKFFISCADFRTRVTMVYAIEAALLRCGSSRDGPATADPLRLNHCPVTEPERRAGVAIRHVS